jgi:hypothetical protein
VKRVLTTINVNAPGVGQVHHIVEHVMPGDTLTVEVDMPLPVEVNGSIVGFMYGGTFHRTTPEAVPLRNALAKGA